MNAEFHPNNLHLVGYQEKDFQITVVRNYGYSFVFQLNSDRTISRPER